MQQNKDFPAHTHDTVKEPPPLPPPQIYTHTQTYILYTTHIAITPQKSITHRIKHLNIQSITESSTQIFNNSKVIHTCAEGISTITSWGPCHICFSEINLDSPTPGENRMPTFLSLQTGTSTEQFETCTDLLVCQNTASLEAMLAVKSACKTHSLSVLLFASSATHTQKSKLS